MIRLAVLAGFPAVLVVARPDDDTEPVLVVISSAAATRDVLRLARSMLRDAEHAELRAELRAELARQ